MAGIYVMLTLGAIFNLIAWKVMETELLLGYTIGVFGWIISVAIGLEMLTKEKK